MSDNEPLIFGSTEEGQRPDDVVAHLAGWLKSEDATGLIEDTIDILAYVDRLRNDRERLTRAVTLALGYLNGKDITLSSIYVKTALTEALQAGVAR